MLKNKMASTEIKVFNPLNASEKEWLRYHEYREKRHMEVSPDDPYIDNKSTENTLRNFVQHPEARIQLFVIADSKTNIQIGEIMQTNSLESSPSYKGTKHILSFDIALLKPYRRKGIGRRALEQIYRYGKELGSSIFLANSSEEDGKNFLKKIGAQIALSGMENRLYLDKVPWKMVNEWVIDGPIKTSQTKLELYHTIPEPILEEYCKTFTEVQNQQPLGQLSIGAMITTPQSYREQEKLIKNMNRVSITILTKESTGEISGLTEVRYNPARETIITQGLTGVKEAFRGRGLGKWLKAAMLLKIREEFPKVKIVSTNNATTNAPMLSINNRLGFKVYKESIIGQISIHQLEKYLHGLKKE